MDLGALVRRLVAGPTGAGRAVPSGDSSASPTPDQAPGNTLARPAWRDLPPLQRMVGAAPLVAPNAAFEALLASSRPAPLALAPLGHDRGLEAPAGLVSGIAAPVQRAPSSPMPARVRPSRGDRGHAAVQRQAAGPTWPESPTEAPAEAFSPESIAPASAPAAAPELVMPAAASLALVTAPDPVAGPAGLVGFVGHAAVASAARGASLPATATAVARSAPAGPSAPLIARSATNAGAVGAPLVTPPSSLDPAAQPSGNRPVRRIRLGAPLTPTISRMAVPGASSAAPGGMSPLPGPGMTSEITLPQGPGAARSAAGTLPPALPTDPLSGDPLPAPLTVVPLQRSAAATAPAMSPLVGGLRPMLASGSPAVAVFRATAPDAEAETPATTPGPSAAMAALARVDPAAADWAPAALAGVATGPSAGGPSFSIEPAARGGISPARLTWSNPMADLSTPSTQPAAGPSTSSIPSAGPGAPTIARSAARTGGLRVGAALNAPAVRPSATTNARSFAAGAASAASSSSISSFGSSAAFSAAPTVSRAVVIDEMDVTPDPSPAAAESGAGEAGAASGGSSATEQGPTGPAGGGSSPAHGGGASEASRDHETQVWADRLYDRIAMRLRHDLLVERERAGALVDRGF